MSRIIILPEDLINKIAAGEVVERPASVVKELIENSIDAGARRITVEVEEGGKKLISVTDNGSGMTGQEVKLALERHSTSKIKTLDDLFSITTLGFRGEALPSIASVSKLEIMSKVQSPKSEVGTYLRAEGGKIKELKDIGCPEGTKVEVRDLFYNTPARLKFLKATSTEMRWIAEVVSKFCLSSPEIAFTLIADGKELLRTWGSGKLMDSLVAVYGVDLAKNLLEVSLSQEKIKVSGFLAKPTLSRIDRDYESFFVNRRFVRAPLLNRAVEEIFRNLIPSSRYPIAILFIDLPAREVDVNVHPTKREVRFLKVNEVLEAIKSAVKKSLESIIPTFEAEELPRAKTWIPPTLEFEVTAIQPLMPITQLNQTYILATDGEDLALIDQHAAHERILFDQINRELTAKSEQPLLIPETINLKVAEALVLEENLETLKSFGFELEAFGKDTYLLRSVPVVLGKVNPRQTILDMIAELANLGKTRSLEVIQESIKKLIACHGAIKAGDKLSADEMSRLIRDLYSTENPLTCPHGRPTMIRFTKDDLERMFERK